MLVIWTSAKSGEIENTFGRALKNFRPSVPEHRFHQWTPEDTAVPDIGPEDVLLASGAKCYFELAKAGIVPKNRTLNGMRERVAAHPKGGRVLCTFDPGILASEPAKAEMLDWDLRLAVRLIRTNSLMPPVGHYQWVDDLQPVIDYVNQQFEKTGDPVYVSMDTETMGLFPWYPDKDIVSISFTAEPHTAHLVYLGPMPCPIKPSGKINLFEQIKWLLTTNRIKLRMANGKFDFLWIAEKWGIECTNFKFDTLLVGTLINENRSNSLNLHAKLFSDIGGYDDPFNQKHDKAHMEKVPTDDLLTYAGGDTDACQQSADVLLDQLVQDGQLANFYVKILHPGARAFEKLERRGVLVDVPLMKEFGHELKEHSNQFRATAMNLLPPKLRLKYMDKIENQLKDGKNPLLPNLLKEFFFTPYGLNLKPRMLTEKTKEPMMSKAHLSMFKDVPAAAAMLAALNEMNGADKTLSTFVEGFLRCVRPDGRIHPSYMLFHGGYQDDEDDESGSVTGRLSAKDPAFQTIPKKTKWAKKLRKCYPAPPGKVMISCLEPSVRVWTRDLRWLAAGDVKVGDELLGFEEFGAGLHRKMRPSVVEKVTRRIARRMRVTLDDGTSLVVSRDHKWLGYHGTAVKWRSTYRLKPGHQIRRVCKVIQPGVSYEDGWLAGMFDGEGWVSGVAGNGWHIGVAQKEGVVLDRLRAALSVRGVPFGDWVSSNAVHQLKVLGSYDAFNLLQAIRPERLISKRNWEGCALPRHGVSKKNCRATVVSIEPVEDGDVVSIQTSTRTFVAEGLASHNCDYSQGELKVVACFAPEPTMLKAYENGLDLHAVTGAKLATVDLAEFLSWKDSADKELAARYEINRSNAKPANFGLLYGMSAAGFQAYAWSNYGLKITLAEAEVMRNAFFDLYPGLLKFHERQRELVAFTQQVRSPLGRIRHLPTIASWMQDIRAKAERQAINCVTEDTEILTPQGWKSVDQLRVGDAAFSVDPSDGKLLATPVLEIHRHTYQGKAWKIDHSAVSAICTPHHRWLIDFEGKARIKFAEDLTMNGHDKLWVASEGMPTKKRTEWTNREVELMGWVLTDGHYKHQTCPKTGKAWGTGRVGVTQSKPQNINEIDGLFLRLGAHSRQVRKTGQHVWEITTPATHRMRALMPDKTLTAHVLMTMSTEQHRILFDTMLKGDGCWDSQAGRYRKFVAGTKVRADAFMMLCAIQGIPCRAVERDFSKYVAKKYDSMTNIPKAGKCWIVELPKSKRAQPQYGSEWVEWSGDVWCPSLQFGTWVAKRNGKVFVTGNSPIQSTLTDMMVWAIALIDDAYPGGEIEVCGMIHDALIAYVPEDAVALWAGRAAEIMSNLPFNEVGWKPQLPFTVDVEAGPNLADLKKLKLAA